MSDPSTVVIVDDHPLFRIGLRRVVESDARFRLIGEAGTGTDGLALIEERRPALAVVDVSLPGMDGIELMRRLSRQRLPTRVVILTMAKDEAVFNRALDAGALGFVLKDTAGNELLAALAAARLGEHYLSPAISGYLIRRRANAERLAQHTPGIDDLTKAERRILRLVADKRTSRQIAAELYISPRTVEAHRANISQKLGLRGNHSLLHFAIENRSAIGAGLAADPGPTA